MRIALCRFGIVLLLTGCASGGEQEVDGRAAVSDETVAVVSSDIDKSEIICKKERTVGSAIPRKICRTRAQMEEEEEEARRTMNQIRGGANSAGASQQ